MSLSDKETKQILRDLGRLIESVGGRDASLIGRFVRHLGGLAPLLEYLAGSQAQGGNPTRDDYRQAARAVAGAYEDIRQNDITPPPIADDPARS